MNEKLFDALERKSKSADRWPHEKWNDFKSFFVCVRSLFFHFHFTLNLDHFFSNFFSFDFLLVADENNSLSQTIPDKPIELCHFTKLCEQRRKFRVLYKLEFQVS